MPGGFGPCDDRGIVGDGSSGSSSRLLRPPELPSPLAFASEPERGAGGGVGGGGGGGAGGGGGDGRRSRRWLVVVVRSFFRFIAGLLTALGRHVIPNRIADILSSKDSNDQPLLRLRRNI